MTIKIVGISGKMGSGKDTAARMLCEIIPGAEQHRFADRLKRTVETLVGVPTGYLETTAGKETYYPAFDATGGQLLQRIGMQLRQDSGEDVWVNVLMEQYNGTTPWVVTDVRFPNEANAVRAAGGIVIRMQGDPTQYRKSTTRDINHVSETALDGYVFDIVLDNSTIGLEALRRKLERIVDLYALAPV